MIEKKNIIIPCRKDHRTVPDIPAQLQEKIPRLIRLVPRIRAQLRFGVAGKISVDSTLCRKADHRYPPLREAPRDAEACVEHVHNDSCWTHHFLNRYLAA